MGSKNNNVLVTKAHNLVEARYQFSVWETRVFTKMVSLVQMDDEDFRNYKLNIRDLISFFDVNDHDAHRKIKMVPQSLMKKIITIPYKNEKGETRFFQTGIVSSATLPEKQDGYIELSFHPNLKPYLLKLQRTFLTYDIRNVLKISSTYSIRIYELLKQYEGLGKRKFDLEDLKLVLGVADKYKLYGHFKQRVIVKAQKDLKKYTDISFSFEEQKKGRKVVAITFFIQNNSKKGEKAKGNNIQIAVKAHNLSVVAQKLQEWGVASEKIKSYQETYSEDYLGKRIQYVANQVLVKEKQGKPILNIAGYFMSIVDNENLVDHVTEQKIKKRASHKSATKSKQLKAELKANIEQLKKELYESEVKFMLDAFAEKTLPTPYIQKAKKGRFSKFDENLSDEENLKSNSLFRGAVLREFRKDFDAKLSEVVRDQRAKLGDLEKKHRLL